MTSLLALNCPRRILLTGTPVQNNLDEFFGKLSADLTLQDCSTQALLQSCSRCAWALPELRTICISLWYDTEP